MRDLVVVRCQRLPLGCRGEVHAEESTARRRVTPGPTSLARKASIAGMAAGSCMKKPWPPSKSASSGAGDVRGQELAVGRRRDPVVAAAAHEGGTADLLQAGGRVVVAPCLELRQRPFVPGRRRARRAATPRRSSPPSRGCPTARPRPNGCRAAGMRCCQRYLRIQADELVQRVRGPARPAGRGAGQRRGAGPARGAGWPALGPPCRRRRHRARGSRPSRPRRAGRRRRRRSRPSCRARPGPRTRPRPRWSYCQELEGRRTGARRSAAASGAGRPRARDEEQALPRAGQLVVEVDAVGAGERHERELSAAPTGRARSAPAAKSSP